MVKRKSKKVKRSHIKIDLSDGVDYVRFNIDPADYNGEFNQHDGTIEINLAEIWDDVLNTDYAFINPEELLIAKVKDTLGHELNHKWFVWGMGEDFIETFNEQDERVMRCISDWINFGKMTKFIEYDYK